jgi:hypothetical protein
MRMFDGCYGRSDVRFDYRHVRGMRSPVLHSGDVWTASANAILNLLASTYLRARAVYLPLGADDDEIIRSVDRARGEPIVIEGDDGLVLDYVLDENVARAAGFAVKAVRHADCRTASFCGIITAENGAHPANITDPVKTMCTFFCLQPKYFLRKRVYANQLMKAKAMSYLYQYHDAPVVGHLAWATYRSLRGVSMTGFAEVDFMRDLILKESGGYDFDRAPEVSPENRALCEELFSLTVEQ